MSIWLPACLPAYLPVCLYDLPLRHTLMFYCTSTRSFSLRNPLFHTLFYFICVPHSLPLFLFFPSFFSFFLTYFHSFFLLLSLSPSLPQFFPQFFSNFCQLLDAGDAEVQRLLREAAYADKEREHLQVRLPIPALVCSIG